MTREMIVLQHFLTDQTMLVSHSDYLAGSKSRFRNFKLKGQGAFIAPPPLDFRTCDNVLDNHNPLTVPKSQAMRPPCQTNM